MQSSASTYTVQGGDSLKSIAQRLWGDASLWYMLADANGISDDGALAAGRTLTVPTVNSNVHNNASTFKPYNAAAIIGDTTPEAIAPPSPSGCGMVGMIIMIVVAIVVTIYTAGAATGLVATALNSAGVATGASTVGGAVAGAIGGAVGGAAGSIASQAVGNITGNVDGFDWKQVAQGAALGAVAGGINGGLNGVDANGIMQPKTNPDIGTIALKSVGRTAGNYLVNKAMNNESFSWRSMAAGVAGGMASESGLTNVSNSNIFVNSIAGSTASMLIRQGFGVQGEFNAEMFVADAFANALGSTMAAGMKSRVQGGGVRIPLRRALQ
ncbi:LysM domain-containing protein [Psychromonas sp. MME2]|uniref:LysM peptidoglycan-binding domain-containing protein n=1 Tax=Psychromonas sp. MME2 TaxID=3231033 RepID=UPI00339CB315